MSPLDVEHTYADRGAPNWLPVPVPVPVLSPLLGVVEPVAYLTWAEGSVVRGVVGTVTARTWPVVKAEDEFAVLDAEDGVIAVTTVWRPGAKEVEVSVLGTDEGAVQAAWESEVEEAAKRTLV